MYKMCVNFEERFNETEKKNKNELVSAPNLYFAGRFRRTISRTIRQRRYDGDNK